MPHGTQDKDKFPPLFSVVGFSFYCAPGVSSFLYFIFDGASPCCFWSSSFSFSYSVHLRATFVMSSDGIRRTCPSHLHFFLNQQSLHVLGVCDIMSLQHIIKHFLFNMQHVLRSKQHKDIYFIIIHWIYDTVNNRQKNIIWRTNVILYNSNKALDFSTISRA